MRRPKRPKKEITFKEKITVKVTRGDGLVSLKNYYGAYDLILECGGNLGDIVDVITNLNAGETVRFGTLRISLL